MTLSNKNIVLYFHLGGKCKIFEYNVEELDQVNNANSAIIFMIDP